MEKRKHTGVNKPTAETSKKHDKKDVIISKYVEENKILKLINRMCNGETINSTQFDTIFNYVKKKGYSSTIQEDRTSVV